MAEHVLKCWPEYFRPMMSGLKMFDLRYNDRNFQVGDILVLREWEPRTETYTGQEIHRRIVYILYGVGHVGSIAPLRGLHTNYVILGLSL